MQADQLLSFGPYRLDLVRGQLWRGTQEVKGTPKALAVLRVLITRPGQVVTKDELFQVVWPQTVVSDAALTSCIQELRQALRDDPRTPRYLETVHRRGYRFIATIATTQPVPSPRSKVQSSYSAIRIPQSAINLVGREAELQQLHGWLKKALNGERQMIFVTGEPGIGKTAVVEAFVSQCRATNGLWLGQGQCIEQFGEGEAYLPILSALGQLGRESGHERLLAVLQQYAPTWLVQLPALVLPARLDLLLRQTVGATRGRMLRELTEALEVLTANQPLVLVLEDLHWSDPSTLEFLSFLARRRQVAKLLVIGTYRSLEPLPAEHPLRAIVQELQLHCYCEELALGLLREEHVGGYLAARPGIMVTTQPPLPALAHEIYQRTDGNPLFMVTLVDELTVQGETSLDQIKQHVPVTLQQLIVRQYERLGPAEQQILITASVAGMAFSAAAVAAGIESEVVAVETQCTALARRAQFVQSNGRREWPDGTVAEQYSFQHTLYRDVLYAQIPAGQRSRRHQRIGEREEQAYGVWATERAAELAVHFEQARDYAKAVQYLQIAAQNALRRLAPQEAITLVRRGLGQISHLSDSLVRSRQELSLQLTLGLALMTMQGYASSELAQTFERAWELCQRIENSPHAFLPLFGLTILHITRAEFQKATQFGQQLVHLARQRQTSDLLLEAHAELGFLSFLQGELSLAQDHFQQGLGIYQPEQHHAHVSLYGQDPGVVCGILLAQVLWLRGYITQALQRVEDTLSLALDHAHPLSLCIGFFWAAFLYRWCGERRLVQQYTADLIALEEAQGVGHALAYGMILQGWAQANAQEGRWQIQQGIATLRSLGQEIGRPAFLALLAEVYQKTPQIDKGIEALDEALTTVATTGEQFYEAELYRLKGELLLMQEGQEQGAKGKSLKSEVPDPRCQLLKPQSEAEACFLKAIEIARKQQAKSWELRATMSLVRLWQQQGRQAEARQMLAEIYGWFTEGFDTVDLKEAKALLEELSH